MEEGVYGPALPPGFKKIEANEETSDSTTLSSLQNRVNLDSTSNNSLKVGKRSSNKEESSIGPKCPLHLLENKYPEDEGGSSDQLSGSEQDDSTAVIGPVLPPGFLNNVESESYDSDSEMPFGPLPAAQGTNDSVYNIVDDIERRAKHMKKKLQEISIPQSEQLQREEWMTLAPSESKNQLGIISRCLSQSSKSDTSEKKNDSHSVSAKDEVVAEELVEYNKAKRSESLLDIHRKARKKKLKDASAVERKPFDRDNDLAVRHFNQEQVHSVIKKARFLNSRFSSGSSQYL